MYIICKNKEELVSIINGIIKITQKIGMYINHKKTKIIKLSNQYKFLQIKYSLNKKGKVIKKINPKSVTRERRRIKAYKRLFDLGKLPYKDIENACRSWMGEYSKIMSKKQIQHIKYLYFKFFDKELIWKRKLYLKMERKLQQNKMEHVTS